MAETTGIAWAHSTFNPWIGCTKVGPGCDHCYAERDTARWKTVKWGAGEQRKRTSPANWDLPRKWNAKAAASGQPWRVFCASLADVYDNEVDPAWRADLFELIQETPALTWMILTKRIGNVERLTPFFMPANVWLGATVVNQEEVDRDVPKLAHIHGVAVRWLSIEPQLGPVFVGHWFKRGIHWAITGGESGAGARPYDLTWARSLIEQGESTGAAIFVKQLGAKTVNGDATVLLQHRAGGDPEEWPADLRVRQFPVGAPREGAFPRELAPVTEYWRGP